MNAITAEIVGIAAGVLLAAGSVGAQGVSIIQNSNGTSGTVIDLGAGIRTYSDSRGTTGAIYDLGGGIQTFNFHSPLVGSQSGTIYSFPSTSGLRSGSNLNFGGSSGRDLSIVAPLIPIAPLPPFMPLAPHTVITPGMGPTSPYSTFGNK